MSSQSKIEQSTSEGLRMLDLLARAPRGLPSLPLATTSSHILAQTSAISTYPGILDTPEFQRNASRGRGASEDYAGSLIRAGGGVSVEYRGGVEDFAAAGSVMLANVCGTCGKAFASSWELKRHINTHIDDRPYKCVYCAHRSNFKHNLKAHQKIVHKDQPFGYTMADAPDKQIFN